MTITKVVGTTSYRCPDPDVVAGNLDEYEAREDRDAVNCRADRLLGMVVASEPGYSYGIAK